MNYLVIFERSKDGSIWANVPDLPGCYSCGNTLEEAKANVKEAIELYLEDLREEGKEAPIPNHLEADLVHVD
jgi:predicted RNase H-like HicB family nuclease